MRSYAQQRGAAILLALVILITIATLASAAVAQHWSALRVQAIEGAALEHKALVRAVMQWGQVLLEQDRRQSFTDTLQEVWAQPLAATPVSEFLGEGDNYQDAGSIVQGKIEDLDGKWNIWPLFLEEKDPGAWSYYLSVTQTLAAQVRLDPEFFANAVSRSREKMMATGFYPSDPQACWRWLGLNSLQIQAVEPYMTCYAMDSTLNINTARVEVLSAIMGPAAAASIVAQRNSAAFEGVNDMASRISLSGKKNLFTLYSHIAWNVRSSWFSIHAIVRTGGVTWRAIQTVRRTENRVLSVSGGVQ